jgi:hypothetical protein
MSELASAGLASLLGVCGTTRTSKGGKQVAVSGEDARNAVAPARHSGSDLQIGVPAAASSGYTSLGAPGARGLPPPSSDPATTTASPAGEPPHGESPVQQQHGGRGGPGGSGSEQQPTPDDVSSQAEYQPGVPAAKPLAEDARSALQSAVDWLQASNNRLKESLQDAEERAVRAESDAVSARRAAEAAHSRLDGAVAEARAAGVREGRAGKVASDSEEMLKLRSDLRTAFADKATAAKEAKARGEEVLNLRAKLQERSVEVTALKEQAARYRGVRDPATSTASSTVNTAAEVAAATSSLHRTIELLKAELNVAHNARNVVLGDLEKMRAACDEVAHASQEDLGAAAARELQLSQRIEALSKADSDLTASDLRQRLRDMQALLTEREAQEARMGAALGGHGGQKSAPVSPAQPPGSAPPPQAPPSLPPPPGGSGLSLQLVAELEALRQEVVRLSHGAARERDGRMKAEDALRAAGLLGAPAAAATSPQVKATPGMGWAQAQRSAAESETVAVVVEPPKPAADDDAPAPVQPPPPPVVLLPPAPAVQAAPVLPPPVAKASQPEEPAAAATPPSAMSSSELPPAPAPGWMSGRLTRGSAGATPSEPHVLVKRRPNPLMSGPSAVGTGAALSAIARKDEEAYARSAVSHGGADDASLVLERQEDCPMPSRYTADDALHEPRQQPAAATTPPPSSLAQLASEMRLLAEASDGRAVARGGRVPGRPPSVRNVPPPPTHAPQQQQQQQASPVSPPVPSIADPSLADELAALMESLGSLKATMAAPLAMPTE